MWVAWQGSYSYNFAERSCYTVLLCSEHPGTPDVPKHIRQSPPQNCPVPLWKWRPRRGPAPQPRPDQTLRSEIKSCEIEIDEDLAQKGWKSESKSVTFLDETS